MDHVMTLQALWTILQGIEKAQSFDPDNVTKTFETMSGIETPYGKGRFGGKDLIGVNRLMVRPIPFTRIVRGGGREYEVLPVK